MHRKISLRKIGERRSKAAAPRAPASAPIPAPLPAFAPTPHTIPFPMPRRPVPSRRRFRIILALLAMIAGAIASYWIMRPARPAEERDRIHLKSKLGEAQKGIVRLKQEFERGNQELNELRSKFQESRPESFEPLEPRGRVTAKTDSPGGTLVVVGDGSAKSPDMITNVKAGNELTHGMAQESRDIKDSMIGAAKPDDPPWKFTQQEAHLITRAKDLYTKDDIKGAIFCYEQVLKTKPECMTALAGLAFFHLEQKRYEEAEVLFRRALLVDDGDAFCLEMLGSVLYEQRRYEEALAAFNRSLARKPDSAFCHNYIGAIKQKKGESAAAEQSFLKAIAIKPIYADAHFNLALCYSLQKPPMIVLARNHYKKARESGSPSNATMEDFLKMAHETQPFETKQNDEQFQAILKENDALKEKLRALETTSETQKAAPAASASTAGASISSRFVGEVVIFNPNENFAVIDFRNGEVPPARAELGVFRDGGPVGNIRIIEPRKPPLAFADVLSGKLRRGDIVRSM